MLGKMASGDTQVTLDGFPIFTALIVYTQTARLSTVSWWILGPTSNARKWRYPREMHHHLYFLCLSVLRPHSALNHRLTLWYYIATRTRIHGHGHGYRSGVTNG